MIDPSGSLRGYCRPVYSSTNTRVCAKIERMAGAFVNLDSASTGDQEPQDTEEGVTCTRIAVMTTMVYPRTMKFACVVCNE